jgi:hypothetical protein
VTVLFGETFCWKQAKAIPAILVFACCCALFIVFFVILVLTLRLLVICSLVLHYFDSGNNMLPSAD